MHKKKLYLETSIFGFYYDKNPLNIEKKEYVYKLFEQIKQGIFEGIVSQYVAAELEKADEIGVDLLKLIKDYSIKVIQIDEDEVENLVNEYIESEILQENLKLDARHVACATVLDVDILVSLNLKHIVNTWKIKGFNGINLKLGYRTIEIVTPMEAVYEE